MFPTPANSRKRTAKRKQGTSTVHIYCHIENEENAACSLSVLSQSVVLVNNHRHTCKSKKEPQFVFKEVLSGTSKKETFYKTALPLLENLFKGSNSLLITHGHSVENQFIVYDDTISRTLDVIFNSVEGHEAPRFMFKSNGQNTFIKQPEGLAHINRYIESRTRKKFEENDEHKRISETYKFADIGINKIFAVFISFIEVSTSSFFDLFECAFSEVTTLQPKLLKCDSRNKMFINDATEIEVRSASEAYNMYSKVLKKRNLGLNQSHLVFNIHLVQDSLVEKGKNINTTTSSQMSIIHVASNGRHQNTQIHNTRAQVLETGGINNSLITLRTCLQIVRENQLCGSSRIVPYRDSKLTHLLKHFFEGDGLVHMIITVNSCTGSYEEILQCMRFGEESSDVRRNDKVVNIESEEALLNLKFTNEDLKEDIMNNGFLISTNYRLQEIHDNLQERDNKNPTHEELLNKTLTIENTWSNERVQELTRELTCTTTDHPYEANCYPLVGVSSNCQATQSSHEHFEKNNSIVLSGLDSPATNTENHERKMSDKMPTSSKRGSPFLIPPQSFIASLNKKIKAKLALSNRVWQKANSFRHTLSQLDKRFFAHKKELDYLWGEIKKEKLKHFKIEQELIQSENWTHELQNDSDQQQIVKQHLMDTIKGMDKKMNQISNRLKMDKMKLKQMCKINRLGQLKISHNNRTSQNRLASSKRGKGRYKANPELVNQHTSKTWTTKSRGYTQSSDTDNMKVNVCHPKHKMGTKNLVSNHWLAQEAYCKTRQQKLRAAMNFESRNRASAGGHREKSPQTTD